MRIKQIDGSYCEMTTLAHLQTRVRARLVRVFVVSGDATAALHYARGTLKMPEAHIVHDLRDVAGVRSQGLLGIKLLVGQTPDSEHAAGYMLDRGATFLSPTALEMGEVAPDGRAEFAVGAASGK